MAYVEKKHTISMIKAQTAYYAAAADAWREVRQVLNDNAGKRIDGRLVRKINAVKGVCATIEHENTVFRQEEKETKIRVAFFDIEMRRHVFDHHTVNGNTFEKASYIPDDKIEFVYDIIFRPACELATLDDARLSEYVANGDARMKRYAETSAALERAAADLDGLFRELNDAAGAYNAALDAIPYSILDANRVSACPAKSIDLY